MAALKRLRRKGWSVGGWTWLPAEQKVGVPFELAALSFFRKFVSSPGGLFETGLAVATIDLSHQSLLIFEGARIISRASPL